MELDELMPFGPCIMDDGEDDDAWRNDDPVVDGEEDPLRRLLFPVMTSDRLMFDDPDVS